MGVFRCARCTGVIALAMLGAFVVSNAFAQPVTPDETARSVRRMLERLPYYGVFDFIVFSVDHGVVTLAGYSFDWQPEVGRRTRRETRRRYR